MTNDPGTANVKKSPACYLFLFFLTFYFLTNAAGYKPGDESIMRVIAKRIADRGEIGVADLHMGNQKALSLSEAWVRGIDGRYYGKWGLGQSIIEAPFFFLSSVAAHLIKDGNNKVATSVLEMLFLFFCPSTVSALGVTIFFLLCQRLGYKAQTALVLSMSYGLLTMVWPYSKSMMSEPSLNTVMLGAVYMMICYRWQNKGIYLLLSGLGCGVAILIKTVAAPLAVIIPVYLLATATRHRRRQTLQDILFWFALPILVFGAMQMAHNHIRYGSPFAFGYALGRDAFGFCTPISVGLWGLLLSPGKSVFLYNPIAIVGILGLRRFFLWRRPEAIFFLAFSALFVLIHAKWWAWAGDWAWGPRFLLVLMPALILPFGTIVENWDKISRLMKIVVMVSIAFSFSVQVLGVFVHPFAFIQVRTAILNNLVGESLSNWGSYSREYIENALVNFSPMFSHMAGNFWLFKHMVFSYELGSDAPWTVLGTISLPPIPMVVGNRVVPDWWPVAFPFFYPGSGLWLWPLAVADALLSSLMGFRLFKRVQTDN